MSKDWFTRSDFRVRFSDMALFQLIEMLIRVSNLSLAHTDSEGLPPKYFGQSYKMAEVLADKIKQYFVNLGKGEQIMKISRTEKRTPDEAFLSEKVAFEMYPVSARSFHSDQWLHHSKSPKASFRAYGVYCFQSIRE